jgi:flagellar biogenesis protein FliO
MTDVSFVDLVVRMIVSLGVVLGLMFGAYWFIRRRQGFAPSSAPGPRRAPAGGGSRSMRAATSALGGIGGFGSRSGAGRSGASRSAGNRRGLRVLGRVGVGRTTQVVAVQFAEKVYLLAASDQAAPAVLAELDMAAWLAATEADDDASVGVGAPIVREAIDPMAPRPSGLLESLREATTRRG